MDPTGALEAAPSEGENHQALEAAILGWVDGEAEVDLEAARVDVESLLFSLTRGTVRAARKEDGEWRAGEWVKQGILLAFRIGRNRESLKGSYRNGWVCRHDLAEACRLAIESMTIDHDIFHVVGTPEARKTCNVERTETVLGLKFRGKLDQYR